MPSLRSRSTTLAYTDEGSGPAPEVVASERDSQGHSHYDVAVQYFRSQRIADYDASQFFDFATGRLTIALAS